MITLFDYELSVDCYGIRLLLALLSVPYTRHPIDYYPGKEHQSPWFIALNSLGELPVIKEDDHVLSKAQAILIYLASRYDTSELWYPRGNPALLGNITTWLGFSETITSTAAAARLHDGMGQACDIEQCRAGAHRMFRNLDEHLWFSEHDTAGWLCQSDHPTIADIAVFPGVQLSEEGGISRRDYPAIRRWLDRVKRLPGFVTMPGIIAPPT